MKTLAGFFARITSVVMIATLIGIGYLLITASFNFYQAHAAPFLVCDPYPATELQPTGFKIVYGTNTIISPAIRNTDGSVQLKWDLGPLVNGTYNLNVSAIKEYEDGWGTQESSSVPFSFTKPVIVPTRSPVNLRLQR